MLIVGAECLKLSLYAELFSKGDLAADEDGHASFKTKTCTNCDILMVLEDRLLKISC
jgi:hypothetical protein